MQTVPRELTDTDRLPSLPATALEVLRLCTEDTTTVNDLGTAIERDPALAAKLLRLANSSMYRRGDAVTSLGRAATMLGLKTVKLMALSFTVADGMDQAKNGALDFGLFWERSLVTAVGARNAARALSLKVDDEAFVCGLLGHVGKLVMSSVLGDQYALLINDNCPWPSLQAERDAFGWDETTVTAALLEAWELPDQIRLPASEVHRPLPENPDALHRVLHIASMCDRVMAGEKSIIDLYDITLPQGLGEAATQELVEQIGPAVGEVAELLDVSLPGGAEELTQRARETLVAVSLDTAADLAAEKERSEELERQNVELEEEARTDRLTGLANRRTFDLEMERNVDARMRYELNGSLGLFIIDLDHFKSVNDNFGHQAGDAVLSAVGAALAETCRKHELCARYGGEEFALIAAHIDPTKLPVVGERIRQTIESLQIDCGEVTLQITASVGAAYLPHAQDEEDVDRLIAAADTYLYEAKETGRNRVVSGPMTD